MRTIAVLADIHGNLLALEAVLADMQQRAIDTVVTLGDHASGPLWPRETLDLLMRQPWLHIRGNHDRQLVQQPPSTHGASDRYAFERLSAEHKDWLLALPALARLEPDILLCHGTPTQDDKYLLENVAHGAIHLATRSEIAARLAGVEAHVILCGHSHLPRIVQIASTLIVNPGSVGLPAYEDSAPEPHVVESGAPHARYALLNQDQDRWQVDGIAVAYDHLSAARHAQQQQRPDWEIALRTGFMRT